MSIPFTVMNVGARGGGPSIYGSEYERAVEEGVHRTGGGMFHAEILHDADLRPELRGRGWWSMLSLYDPDIPAGTEDAIYFGGLDTVFVRDLPRLIRALDAVDADIVGIRDFYDGGWASGVMRVRKRSRGCTGVWERAASMGFQLAGHRHDHAIRRLVPDHIGFVDDGVCQSYKVQAGHGVEHESREPGTLEDCCVVAFHGRPRPHEVYHNEHARLGEFVRRYWRPDAV